MSSAPNDPGGCVRETALEMQVSSKRYHTEQHIETSVRIC